MGARSSTRAVEGTRKIALTASLAVSVPLLLKRRDCLRRLCRMVASFPAPLPVKTIGEQPRSEESIVKTLIVALAAVSVPASFALGADAAGYYTGP